MLADIASHSQDFAALCRRHGVRRLDVFGSAARATDFDPTRSDADFLVSFTPGTSLEALTDLNADLEALLGRAVDLVEREAVQASRNFIRRRRILTEAQPVYG